MGKHSILAPSSAHRWVKCPGSVLAELTVPPESKSTAASEGDLTHRVGAQLIDFGCRGLLNKNWKHHLETNLPKDKRGFIPDRDMIQAAHGYAWEVFRVLRTLKIFGGPHMGIEDRLEIPRIHQTMIGTPDAWVYSARDDILIIWDLKYGFLPVEPFENYQLICYFAGIDHKLGELNHETKVHFRIYQPRAPHPQGIYRRWKTTAGELDTYVNELHRQAERALGDNPPTVPGAHCRYCRARYACTACQRAALNAADYVGTPMPVELDEQGLAVELAILEHAATQLDYRLTAIREQAERLLRGGGRIPGYRLAEGRGRTVWKLPRDTVLALADVAGVDLRKGIMTPKQAAEAGLDESTLGACTERLPGKMSVKQDDGSLARMVFGGGEDG
jgi:hypothetical protein